MAARIIYVDSIILDNPPSIDARLSIVTRAVKKCDIQASRISAILSVGIDLYTQPSDSIFIAGNIGASSAFCASINNSCASFVNAIDLAKSLLQNAQEKTYIIIVASSIFGDIVNEYSKGHYANGVGVAIVSNWASGINVAIINYQQHGKFFGLKTITPYGANFNRYSLTEKRDSPEWNEYREAVLRAPVELVRKILREKKLEVVEIDSWIFHQSELTRKWSLALGIQDTWDLPNMGSLTSIAMIHRIWNDIPIDSSYRIIVVEIGLGMTIACMLLEREI
jgi:3-oxoacyl-[acyl-carrier-protein] synthase III